MFTLGVALLPAQMAVVVVIMVLIGTAVIIVAGATVASLCEHSEHHHHRLSYSSVFFFWLSWVFVAALDSSLVAVSGGYSLVAVRGLPLWRLLLLWSTGSRLCSLPQLWLLGSRAQTQ